MTRVGIDRAWAAGFWDGEGCTSISVRPGTARVPRIVAEVAQVDREVLDRFAAIVGIGRVNGPYEQKNPNARPFYTWRVEGVPNLLHLKEILFPYLGTVKREQMLHGIETRQTWEATATCELGHRLSQSERGHWRCHTCFSALGKKNMRDRWGDISGRTSKTCSSCRVEKPLSEFNKRARSGDGHQAMCRACAVTYRKERQVMSGHAIEKSRH